jgi:hypothetical protein
MVNIFQMIAYAVPIDISINGFGITLLSYLENYYMKKSMFIILFPLWVLLITIFIILLS